MIYTKHVLYFLMLQSMLTLTAQDVPSQQEEVPQSAIYHAIQGLAFGAGHGLLMPPLSLLKSVSDGGASIVNEIKARIKSDPQSLLVAALFYFTFLYCELLAHSGGTIRLAVPLIAALLGYFASMYVGTPKTSFNVLDSQLSIVYGILMPPITLAKAGIEAVFSLGDELEDMVLKTQQLTRLMDGTMHTAYAIGSTIATILWFRAFKNSLVNHSKKTTVIVSLNALLSLIMTSSTYIVSRSSLVTSSDSEDLPIAA